MIQEAENAVAGRVLLDIEKYFIRHVRENYDEGLSMLLISDLLPMMSTEQIQNLDGLLSSFCEEKSSDLKRIFEKKRDPVRYPLLLQPESILIFFLLTNEPFEIEDRWPQRLSEDDLRKFKVLWGAT